MAYTGRTAPPFYANENDNLHCGQACLRMASEHLTQQTLTSQQADLYSDFAAGDPAFLPATISYLNNQGISITCIMPNPPALAMHDLLVIENRAPEITDVVAQITDGSVVISSLNYFALVGGQGQPIEEYSGHYVLIYDVDIKNQRVLLHNPGLPAMAAQETSFENLIGAMRGTRTQSCSLIALKAAA